MPLLNWTLSSTHRNKWSIRRHCDVLFVRVYSCRHDIDKLCGGSCAVKKNVLNIIIELGWGGGGGGNFFYSSKLQCSLSVICRNASGFCPKNKQNVIHGCDSLLLFESLGLCSRERTGNNYKEGTWECHLYTFIFLSNPTKIVESE